MIYGPYRATVAQLAYDGDTVALFVDLASLVDGHEFDLGFGVSYFLPRIPIRLQCRVYGIDCPELNSKDPDVKAQAVAARDFTRECLPVGEEIRVVSHGWDKYGGRFDGEITLHDGFDLAELLVAAGLAVRKDFT